MIIADIVVAYSVVHLKLFSAFLESKCCWNAVLMCFVTRKPWWLSVSLWCSGT